MRIAYMGVKGLPAKSGTERVVEGIVSKLVDKHEITVYCEGTYTPPDTKIDGVKLIRITTPKGKYLKPISYNGLCALHALFKGNYDVIHLNGIETCFILPFLKLKYPVVSTSHGSGHSAPRDKWGKLPLALMISMAYPYTKLSNFPTSISKLDAVELESRFKKRVIYIPNGVDTNVRIDEKGSLRALSQLGVEPHGFLLFAAGRVIHTKGCHLAIEAYKSISTEIPFVVMGDINQVPAYGEMLKQMGAGRRVIFTPPITEKSIFFGILKLCKLFIFPSLSEGMSMMMLEAASLGVPMICSDIPENKIVMKDLTLYFKSGDSKDLSKKMLWAIQHPDEMHPLSQKASHMVSTNLSWEKIAEQYEILYQACVTGKKDADLGFGDYSHA